MYERWLLELFFQGHIFLPHKKTLSGKMEESFYYMLFFCNQYSNSSTNYHFVFYTANHDSSNSILAIYTCRFFMHKFDCLGELLCQWHQNTMFLNHTTYRIPQQLEVCRSAVKLVYIELLNWTDSLSDLQVERVRPQTHHPHQRSSRSEMRERGH